MSEVTKCEFCNYEIPDNEDAWECNCGAICCEQCIDGDGDCPNCHDNRDANNIFAIHYRNGMPTDALTPDY